MDSIFCSLEITGKCNLTCIHCYADSSPHVSLLSLDRNIKLIDALSKLSPHVSMNIKGGEPLVSSDLYTILDYATNLKFKLSLTTNGTLITNEFCTKLIELNIKNNIYVSLDGAREDINDYLRGKGAFRKTIEGIAALRRANIRFAITTVANSFNISNMAEIAGLACRLGATIFHLVKFSPEGRGKDNRFLNITEAEFLTSALEVANYHKPISTYYDDAIIYSCDESKKITFVQDKIKHIEKPFSYSIHWNGSVSISCMKKVIGNIASDELENIVSSALINESLLDEYRLWLSKKNRSTAKFRRQLCID